MSPKEYLISQIALFFVEYAKGQREEEKLFFHMEEEFHVGIFIENEEQVVYQLNSDHEAQGIPLETWKDLEVRFKSFTGEDVNFVSERNRKVYEELEQEESNSNNQNEKS